MLGLQVVDGADKAVTPQAVTALLDKMNSGCFQFTRPRQGLHYVPRREMKIAEFRDFLLYSAFLFVEVRSLRG